ncbi:BTB/POZ domain-containing protein KCTD6-like [Tubulanus polymorphus]|uniref:BTB/POZ domain-containing protein KCTD6-like n=1 Tax=Tubulanus polymorphus TaxID=672921 RepID=UPI003DA28DA1
MMSDEVIVLNVGGVQYTTTLSTLSKYPHSMLGVMFSGQFGSASVDGQGNYFIDRDGETFKHVLNFLRTSQLCLPQGFKDWDLLEAEADFYQILPLIDSVKELKARSKGGRYLEFLDFEESAYFDRHYIPPLSRTSDRELKSGGLVISGHVKTLKLLPLPDKTLQDLEGTISQYKTVHVSTSVCSKIAIINALGLQGWELVETSFANNTDQDGSYIVHKYVWYHGS